MTAAELRDWWLQQQQADVAWANEQKQGQEALLSVSGRYRRLLADERPVIDELLGEELGSDDETERFVALALIEDFRIKSALPALRRLADRLETATWPGAPYEWAKVNRIMARLASDDQQAIGE